MTRSTNKMNQWSAYKHDSEGPRVRSGLTKQRERARVAQVRVGGGFRVSLVCSVSFSLSLSLCVPVCHPSGYVLCPPPPLPNPLSLALCPFPSLCFCPFVSLSSPLILPGLCPFLSCISLSQSLSVTSPSQSSNPGLRTMNP